VKELGEGVRSRLAHWRNEDADAVLIALDEAVASVASLEETLRDHDDDYCRMKKSLKDELRLVNAAAEVSRKELEDARAFGAIQVSQALRLSDELEASRKAFGALKADFEAETRRGNSGRDDIEQLRDAFLNANAETATVRATHQANARRWFEEDAAKYKDYTTKLSVANKLAEERQREVEQNFFIAAQVQKEIKRLRDALTFIVLKTPHSAEASKTACDALSAAPQAVTSPLCVHPFDLQSADGQCRSCGEYPKKQLEALRSKHDRVYADLQTATASAEAGRKEVERLQWLLRSCGHLLDQAADTLELDRGTATTAVRKLREFSKEALAASPQPATTVDPDWRWVSVPGPDYVFVREYQNASRPTHKRIEAHYSDRQNNGHRYVRGDIEEKLASRLGLALGLLGSLATVNVAAIGLEQDLFRLHALQKMARDFLEASPQPATEPDEPPCAVTQGRVPPPKLREEPTSPPPADSDSDKSTLSDATVDEAPERITMRWHNVDKRFAIAAMLDGEEFYPHIFAAVDYIRADLLDESLVHIADERGRAVELLRMIVREWVGYDSIPTDVTLFLDELVAKRRSTGVTMEPLAVRARDIDQIRAREHVATPGPWHVAADSNAPGNGKTSSWLKNKPGNGKPSSWLENQSDNVGHIVGAHSDYNDLQFIAHARTDIPMLLNHVAIMDRAVQLLRDVERDVRMTVYERRHVFIALHKFLKELDTKGDTK